jgi:predicted RNA-binding protein with PIN domain/Skp family chaperone for outer membrane proteins
VRRHLSDLAAAVLGELTPPEVPSSLVRVREFAPARRSRAGAGPLAATLDRDPAFRQHVAAAWRALHPELAAEIDAGSPPITADPALALAGLYLLRPPDWTELARPLASDLGLVDHEVATRHSDAALRGELQAARQEAERLRAELSAQKARAAGLEEELSSSRREARKLRSDADRARAQAREALAEAAADRERLEKQAREQEEVAREAADRVRRAAERVEQSRRAEREGRSLADTRLRLLLDTLIEAAGGLRRELALPPADVRPADLVTSSSTPDSAVPAPQGRGLPPEDPALLSQLLALPQVHLIVDGYNVTKTGYGTQPLAEQRRRLIDGLAALAARTRAEVTCCFDGADVEVSSAWRTRGVRVLFSEPGTTADELVRRLVRAEPRGRPVVVVSTDGEVVQGVRAAGAHPVPAEALLRLLARS